MRLLYLTSKEWDPVAWGAEFVTKQHPHAAFSSLQEAWHISVKLHTGTHNDMKHSKAITHIETHTEAHAEPNCEMHSSNSRAPQCRNVSNWKSCIQNYNHPKSLLTFTWYSKCLSVGVTQAGFQNTNYLFFVFWRTDCHLTEIILWNHRGYITSSEAWAESTCPAAHKTSF